MIGKDSYRVQAIMSKKEGKKIEEVAEKENRSVSNWVAMVLKRELKKVKG